MREVRNAWARLLIGSGRRSQCGQIGINFFLWLNSILTDGGRFSFLLRVLGFLSHARSGAGTAAALLP